MYKRQQEISNERIDRHQINTAFALRDAVEDEDYDNTGCLLYTSDEDSMRNTCFKNVSHNVLL